MWLTVRSEKLVAVHEFRDRKKRTRPAEFPLRRRPLRRPIRQRFS
jgi:hypothetical protein